MMSPAYAAREAASALNIKRIRALIAVYFVLLIFEGALRKWVAPSLANPLLVVRDPVVVGIYILAWRAGIFPRNIFTTTLCIIAALSIIFGVFAPYNEVTTSLYGVHANFLHLPLIFIIGRVFTPQDVRKYGYWILLLAIPLSLLMVLQFLSPPQSIINAGVSGKFEQLTGARGHIRPPATFSFISGPCYYYALVASFLLSIPFSRSNQPPHWLSVAGSSSLALAMIVSISRTLIANVGLAFICAFGATVLLVPRLVPRWIVIFGFIALIGYAAVDNPLLQEGLGSLNDRVTGASKVEETSFVGRFLQEFTNPADRLYEAPLWGDGLGLGTVGGQALAASNANAPIISSEGEWSRNILESGPLLGGAFIVWRICFFLWLGKMALESIKRGNPLPLLLYSWCGLLLLIGQFSQSTEVGFGVLAGGLCLAAAKITPPTRT